MSIPMASASNTIADEMAGYPVTRSWLAKATTRDLQREYLEGIKAGFNAMFGHNARKFNNLVADELLSRGETEIPNIFGPIAVRRFTW